MPPLLEIGRLSVTFGDGESRVLAVDELSFAIEKGETLGIVGESGSGKSVTALSIMRLLPQPAARVMGGSIYLHTDEGKKIDLLNLPEKEMRKLRGRRLGMIFQEPMTALNPVFRCGDQLLEAIRIHQSPGKAEARRLAIDWLAKVQLPDPDRIFRSYPHQLSGGQKQRVLIAMAMCCRPQILIADEPTTALDVTVQKEILQLIRNLQEEYGAAVIFISHDLGVIAEIADQVLVMRKGKEMERGNVLDIFSSPRSSYTRGLLACRPPLDYRLRRLPVIDDFLLSGEEGRQSAPAVVPADLRIDENADLEKRKKRLQEPPLLRVIKLKTWFPKEKNFLGKPLSFTKAVDDVSFEVYPGEVIGLVGESGCGKTTLGRTIIQLQPSMEGEVFFKEQNIAELKGAELKKLRQSMQIVFQDPYSSLNPRLTIGSALLEPMAVHKIGASRQEREGKIVELIEKVGLSAAHLSRYPHEFSGGQRQRICIARALCLKPEFIVFDESVSALDVSVQAQIINLILSLREEMNFTCIFISHDLSVVKFISDRMFVMNDGKIIESGWPEEIYANPRNEYTRKLIGAIPKGRIEDIRDRLNRKKGQGSQKK